LSPARCYAALKIRADSHLQGVWVMSVTRLLIAASILSAPLALLAAPAAAEVTFSKDIAPILQRSCENCHRPDGVAPMSLVSYDDVRPWARAIKMRTSLGPKAGVMPPVVHREEHRHPEVQR